MTELEKLKKEYEYWDKQCDENWKKYMNMALDNIPYNEAVAWYETQPATKKCVELKRQIRMLENNIEWEPFNEWDDDVYTLEEFIGMCKDGSFVDYDGYGIYADNIKKMKTNIEVYPSDITSRKYRKDFTHIVWYNK